MPFLDQCRQWRHLGWCHPGRQLTVSVSPLFFPLKNWRPFLVIAVCKVITFFYLFDLVCPLFFLNSFHSGIISVEGVIRGGPPPPSDASVNGIWDCDLTRIVLIEKQTQVNFSECCDKLFGVWHPVHWWLVVECVQWKQRWCILQKLSPVSSKFSLIERYYSYFYSFVYAINLYFQTISSAAGGAVAFFVILAQSASVLTYKFTHPGI